MKRLFILILTSFYVDTIQSQTFEGQVNYNDNRKLLDDNKVNPKFSLLIKEFMDSAKKVGFMPVVHEAFRSQQKAIELNKKNSKLGIAAASVSVHSFGLAVDIWLANDKGEIFSFDPKDYNSNKANRFSYATWMKFIRIGESFGLINAYNHDDTDHWELHPNWSKKDWVNAKKVALPIYNKNHNLTDLERLQQVWLDAGL